MPFVLDRVDKKKRRSRQAETGCELRAASCDLGYQKGSVNVVFTLMIQWPMTCEGSGTVSGSSLTGFCVIRTKLVNQLRYECPALPNTDGERRWWVHCLGETLLLRRARKRGRSKRVSPFCQVGYDGWIRRLKLRG